MIKGILIGFLFCTALATVVGLSASNYFANERIDKINYENEQVLKQLEQVQLESQEALFKGLRNITGLSINNTEDLALIKQFLFNQRIELEYNERVLNITRDNLERESKKKKSGGSSTIIYLPTPGY